MSEAIQKERLEDGSTRISSPKCSFQFRVLGAGALLVTIRGRDRGQFGPAVFEEIRYRLGGPASLELFVDAAEAAGPTTEVSDAWTRFFRTEGPQLKRVSILALSKFVHLTVSVAKLFSRTGELIQVYSDPALFHAAVERAVPKKRQP